MPVSGANFLCDSSRPTKLYKPEFSEIYLKYSRNNYSGEGGMACFSAT